MTTLSEIQAQIASLIAQEQQIRQEQYSKAVTEAQAIITSFDIKPKDLNFNGSKQTPNSSVVKSTRKVEIKYRDESGNAWSGRGLKPGWLKAALESGKSLSDFAVQQTQP